MAFPPLISSNQSPKPPSLYEQIDTLVSGLSKMKRNSSLSSYEKVMYLQIFTALNTAFPSLPNNLKEVLDHPESQENLDKTIRQLREIKTKASLKG